MSFSSATKNELSRVSLENRCCAIAELAALVRMNGYIHLSGNGKINLKFTTENAAIARRTFSLIKKLYHMDINVMVRKNKQLKKNNNYLVAITNTEDTRRILMDVGFISKDTSNNFRVNYRIPTHIVSNRCCKRAYIRGAFLGGGSISNPERTYHLEFVTNNEEHGKELSNLINSFGLDSKVILRKDSFVVYLKESEQIVDLLNIMEAHQALLKLEDIRVLKDMRNNINRLVNCETANLGKTINASLRQAENIEYIENTIGLEKLPQNLREIARLRLEYRDASLKELGTMLNPPIGKSGINHRLRRIDEIADKIRRGKQY